MKRTVRGLLLLLMILVGGTAMAENRTEITVDFSQREGVPLLKKYALFNSGIVDLPHYIRDAELFDGLRVDSLRIDLFMGEQGRPFARVVDGTADALVYDFDKLDQLVALLAEHDVRPYWAWSYIPYPLQQDGDWRKGPSDLAAWQEMFRVFAAHYRESGLRVAYHEVYNEPDCGDVFFLGSMQDYTQLYISAVRGLKAGDPDAVVGGPSSAFVDITGATNIRHFLNHVAEAGVPLDFFSYHSYGCDTKQYLNRTGLSRKYLSEYVHFDTTELHLNEYNSLLQPFEANGPAEHSRGGATMLTSFQLLLEETDVTLAHWAQFMDTGYEPLGAIDPFGRIKAPYWAYWMYSQMPEQRVRITGLPEQKREGLHAMASCDKETACILAWNDDAEKAVSARITLPRLPFSQGNVEIYVMNDAVDPYWNTNGAITVKPTQVMAVSDFADTIALDIPAGGFVMYRFVKGDVTQEAVQPVGEMIRKRYYFPERGKSSYSFFDETDQTVYLGMNGEYSARATVAAEWNDLPDMVFLNSRFGGKYMDIDLNTSFSVRVDYAVEDAYTKSVLFTFMPINPRRNCTMPWGTMDEPDEIVLCSTLLTGKTLLMLRNYAPEGWEGRAIVTYDMHSTGPDTWAELTMSGL